jgi:hypothetical protein
MTILAVDVNQYTTPLPLCPHLIEQPARVGQLPVLAEGVDQAVVDSNVRESHATRKLTPKEGNAVEPASWEKESAEGMRRRQAGGATQQGMRPTLTSFHLQVNNLF